MTLKNSQRDGQNFSPPFKVFNVKTKRTHTSKNIVERYKQRKRKSTKKKEYENQQNSF